MPHTLLKPYFLSQRNKLIRDNSKFNLKRDLLLAFVALLTMFCIYIGFYLVFKKMESNILFQELVPGKLIELIIYSFFFVIILSSSVSAIGNIFNAKNMEFLLYLPVSSFRIYLTKLVNITAESGLMMFVFGLPAAFAYVFVLGVDISFIPMAAFVSIPILLIPVGLSVAIGLTFISIAAKIWNRGARLTNIPEC